MAEEKRNLNVLDRLRQLFQGNIIIRKKIGIYCKTTTNKMYLGDSIQSSYNMEIHVM